MHREKVAVVILNWNGKDWLAKFLPAVIQYSPQAAIVVADNKSTDDSLAFLRQNFPAVNIVQNSSNKGFAEGYNDALKQVDAEYYVLLNSDVEVCDHWIDPIIELMDKEKDIAACQPKILSYTNKEEFEYAGACGGYIDKYGYPFCRGRIFNTLEKDQGQYEKNVEIHWATGACMFIRAAVFHEMKGFDKDYFAHMEEIDLCWRIKNRGYRIMVVPAAKVYHVGGGTLNKSSTRKTYLNFRNNLITYAKNHAGEYLFAKIIFRLLLDGLAAVKFLVMERSPGHFSAVIKAHFAFYTSLAQTFQKRKQLITHPHYKSTKSGILNQSIVYLYYVKRNKLFSEIAKENLIF